MVAFAQTRLLTESKIRHAMNATSVAHLHATDATFVARLHATVATLVVTCLTKFGEDPTSLLAFCRREKNTFCKH